MDMSSTKSCPPDVSMQQSTKQNFLVEGSTRDSITSPTEDPINENPSMGKTSQDNYPRSKSFNSNQSSTTEEVVLEIPVTSQNQQMSNRNQQKKRNGKKTQQKSTEKISNNDDIVFHAKNDLTNDNNE